MEQAFYRDRLSSRFGINVLVPDEHGRTRLHKIIYNELVAGQILEPSRATCREIIAQLVQQGAQAIILGCTELMLLIQPNDSPVPLYDTTTLHAEAAVIYSLQP